MHQIWEEYRGYFLLRRYAALCTRSCFSSVRIEGTENIPTDGAVIVAPNHCCALMDPMVVMLAYKDKIGFGARSDIFANPRTGAILRWLRILPIARERNGLSEVAKNFDIFDEIVDCLAHDVPYCLYSEGMHRAERGMLPVKKGIFRIAKLAVERIDKPVYVVPMGLDYEYFFRTQGRVAIRIGEPMNMTELFAAAADRPEGDVYRDLCTDLRERILALIGRIPERRHGQKLLRALAGLVLLPLFLVCAVAGFPIWLTHAILLARMKDKAWSHTLRFILHLVLPIFIPFDIGFGRILNLYRNLVEDLK